MSDLPPDLLAKARVIACKWTLGNIAKPGPGVLETLTQDVARLLADERERCAECAIYYGARHIAEQIRSGE